MVMSDSEPAPSKPATIYDVARRAGVSHQTVTRLLNGFEGIKPTTRQRVLDALEELNYRPNLAARQLRSSRSNRIGALADEMAQTGPGRVIQGAVAGAREAGYVLDIVSMTGDDESSIAEALTYLELQQVAGIFATAQTDQVKAVLDRHPPRVPILVDYRIGHELDAEGLSFDVNGGVAAGNHLVGLGHRRVACLAGPNSWHSARDRVLGFVEAVEAAGATCELVMEGDWSPESGHDAGLRFPLDRGITGVFAANDYMGLGFMRALAERGVRVPEDVSVIGFDDIPEARFLTPPLTSVAIDFEAEGDFAIRWLIANIEGGSRPSSAEFPAAELVVRDSTAPPPSR